MPFVVSSALNGSDFLDVVDSRTDFLPQGAPQRVAYRPAVPLPAIAGRPVRPVADTTGLAPSGLVGNGPVAGNLSRMGEPDQNLPDPRSESLPVALGDSGLQSQTLESVADAENYHEWLTSLALPYLGDNPIELGSGLGDYASRWLANGIPQLTVTEVDPVRLAALKERFRQDERVSVLGIDVFNPAPADFSAFAAYNVLEHIPDDVGALRAAHTLVRPGGAVIMFVPAFNFAMSNFDRQVGHVRRYTVKSLTAAMTDAGLEVETVKYVNIPGLFAWVVGMRLLRMTPGNGSLLSFWDNRVIPLTRSLEAKRSAPFGQSVFAVARVPRSR